MVINDCTSELRAANMQLYFILRHACRVEVGGRNDCMLIIGSTRLQTMASSPKYMAYNYLRSSRGFFFLRQASLIIITAYRHISDWVRNNTRIQELTLPPMKTFKVLSSELTASFVRSIGFCGSRQPPGLARTLFHGFSNKTLKVAGLAAAPHSSHSAGCMVSFPNCETEEFTVG